MGSRKAGELASRNVGKGTAYAVGEVSPRQSQVPVSEVTAEGVDSEEGREGKQQQTSE